MLTLSDLNPGEKAKVCGFSDSNPTYRRKLLAMGLTPNTLIEVIRRAPLGDPIQIRIHQCDLSLRQSESQIVQIERVSE